ncbi:DUF4167 domain-containing protein [Paracoccus caeni]|uniref:DUF4167 domain-containing protein n=1 Tax=Paracoccus caeni TaxID=657651 RepID=A0A934VX34_9RHOB|nr:DUF4167 domain-containing protein [Paracoccus caeni]MBK4214562.1 DUF4167 domain-containing protein [Paracoccus caeni]
MRSSKSRSRNKSNRQRSLGNIVNRVFDSSGPEGKVRGTPQQIIEKYLTLARDAQLSNDRVAEQSFLQHAEHYTRMLGEAQREMAERQGSNPRQDDDGNVQQPREHQGSGGNGNGHQSNGNGNGNGREHNRDYQQNRDGRDGFNRDRNRRDHVAEQQPPARQDEAEQAAPVEQPVQVMPDVSVQTDDALPVAMAANDDDTSGPVETPETAPKPRSRAPRAPRPVGEAAASAPAKPRNRRKTASAEPAPSEGSAE